MRHVSSSRDDWVRLMAKYLHIHIPDLKLKTIVSFLTCLLLVKFPGLSGDPRPRQEAGDSDVPPRGRTLLETAQTAGVNQNCYMSENLTKSLDNNQLSVSSKVNPYLVSYILLFKTNHSALMDKL